MWADPDGEVGEANMLATHVSRGLADGTFCNDDGDPLGVTVLFRRGTRMPEYETAFAAEGLRVRTATDALFDCPAVETALAVCEWLTAPGSPQRTSKLLTESPLNTAFDAAPFEARSWDLDRVLDADPAAVGEEQRGILRGLIRLRDRSDAFGRLPASEYVEDVIEALALRADPNGYVGDTDPDQRVANLDALVETLSEWEGTIATRRRSWSTSQSRSARTPVGPTQPSTAGAAYDVESSARFTDPRGSTSSSSLTRVRRLVSRSPHPAVRRAGADRGGLAPPTNTDVPDDIAIPPFDGGLYGAGDGWDRDVGLRWATARWRDTVSTSVSDSANNSADRNALVGPDRLCRVANERAEAWRLLYVALTVRRELETTSLFRYPARIWRTTRPETGGSTRFATGWRSDAAAPTPTTCCSTRIRTGTRSRSASTTRTCSLDVLVRLVGLGATRPPNPATARPARPVGPTIPEPQHNVPADGGCGSVRARPPAGRAAAHGDERGSPAISLSDSIGSAPRRWGRSSRRAHGTGRPQRRRTGDSNGGTGGARGLR